MQRSKTPIGTTPRSKRVPNDDEGTRLRVMQRGGLWFVIKDGPSVFAGPFGAQVDAKNYLLGYTSEQRQVDDASDDPD